MLWAISTQTSVPAVETEVAYKSDPAMAQEPLEVNLPSCQTVDSERAL